MSLQWRHNGHDDVSNHQPHDCLLNRLFRRRSKKTSKLRTTGLCQRNSPVTGEFPAHRASNAENISILWRHHDPNQWRMTQFTVAICIYCLQCLTKNIINDACPWAVWEYHISLLYTIRRAQQKLKNDTRPDIIEILQLAEKHIFIDRQFQYRFDHTMSCHYGA